MRTMARLLMASALTLLAACASSPTPSITPQASVDRSHPGDVGVLHTDVQRVLDALLAQEQQAGVTRADLEAAASIVIPDHRTIHGALTLFTTRMRDEIQASLTRSAHYRKIIDKALRQYHLPLGLAYLPVIESAYKPSLTSRAGAHGIWQFMPETAREYGLRVDWWIDERADPEKSTLAAAAYLSDLYRDFKDWSLALAAYNAGAGRVRRALSSTGSTSFWQLLEQGAIPRETRGYVPTFYATLLIVGDPATYGFRLDEPAEREQKQVEVEGPISLAWVAEAAGVDGEELRGMNPALRRALVPPGPATINVPSRAATLIESRARTLRNEDALIAMSLFRMRPGDSLKTLARSLGISPDTLMAINSLSPYQSVGEGSSIYVPVRARDLSALLAGAHYEVRKGDTLYSIARHHGLSVQELRELNDLPEQARLHPGQHLRVNAPRPLTAGN